MSWLNKIISMEVFCKQKAPNTGKVYFGLVMTESSCQIENLNSFSDAI